MEWALCAIVMVDFPKFGCALNLAQEQWIDDVVGESGWMILPWRSGFGGELGAVIVGGPRGISHWLLCGAK